jgi:hypothetical protein
VGDKQQEKGVLVRSLKKFTILAAIVGTVGHGRNYC